MNELGGLRSNAEEVGEDVVIDVRGLRMRYGSVDVLKGVEFTACRGEVLALLGPNGAGAWG
jgi:ABC-2 type transport system ATP-binding protein